MTIWVVCSQVSPARCPPQITLIQIPETGQSKSALLFKVRKRPAKTQFSTGSGGQKQCNFSTGPGLFILQPILNTTLSAVPTKQAIHTPALHHIGRRPLSMCSVGQLQPHCLTIALARFPTPTTP